MPRLHPESHWTEDLAFAAFTPRKTVTLTEGDDRYTTGKTGERVLALGGNDSIDGRAGDDILSGGDGNDSPGGHRGNDILYGGQGDDGLVGGNGGDRLLGGNGNDQLFGGRNGDVLIGGLGSDRIETGTTEGGSPRPDDARDRVIYSSVQESKVDAPDSVWYFGPRTDIFDLHKIDADTTLAGNQAFHFVGDAAFSHTAGELAYHPASQQLGLGILEADTNGDGTADFLVRVSIVGPDLDLTDANFTL